MLIDNQSLLIRVAMLFACVIVIVLLMALFVETLPVKALPEYTTLTGESCGVCHINPGGAGPRTLSGLLWAARGKPVQMPVLPTMLLAPDVRDGFELYGIACAGCHGARGEGSSGMGLVGTGISLGANRSFLLYGIKPLGMPGFKGQLTDEQVDVLSNFVTNLADSEAPPPQASYMLAPAKLHGQPAKPLPERGGN
jgi:mono/diheme cytochrome c family protein